MVVVHVVDCFCVVAIIVCVVMRDVMVYTPSVQGVVLQWSIETDRTAHFLDAQTLED